MCYISPKVLYKIVTFSNIICKLCTLANDAETTSHDWKFKLLSEPLNRDLRGPGPGPRKS